MIGRHERQAAAEATMRRGERINAAIASIMSGPCKADGATLYNWLHSISGVWEEAPATDPARTAWIGHRALGMTILLAFRNAAPGACFEAETIERADRENEAELLRRAREEDADESAADAIYPQPPTP